ncbi:MAG: F0F1 ATP synthase subunit alpha [Lachnospiraceae bacterium]|nr:F0F1 ATP synthase subunit alpha [Lachnospiraceae bacterium]
MTQTINKYLKSLRDNHVSKEEIVQVKELLVSLPQILEDLANPTIALEKRHKIIDKDFPLKVRDTLKLMCDNEDIRSLKAVMDTFFETEEVKPGVLRAKIRYVTAPSEEQLEGIRRFLAKQYEYETDQIEFVMTEDEALIGGFIISVGTDEYDWSNRNRLKELEQMLSQAGQKAVANEEDVISILRQELSDFQREVEGKEVGYVNFVGDGIADITGLDHAMYGEIVLFDNGIKGMVQDIRRDEIGCILFGKDTDIKEGTRVIRTEKRAGVPVGEGFLGRVVNALGAPIDGKGEIAAAGFRPIENDAPTIVDRKSVSVPMETGTLAIDAMFPIGRGQRELIIGDRQTGKTSIAIDAMLNQKGKDVICVYVAIGQKASTVAKIVNTLKTNGALDYSIVVSATASDPASLQYIAPYAGAALAEYFMYQGKDVLIIYDDLSKHAVAYRALSLLLERSPGREAYPGDVFYLHSRLLERASRLAPEAGGGSITALPIIETQAGDVSAYIPTNVISITDGQIFLESDLFFAGIRPAVNVGLSVSRVGGAAQTKAMKKAAGGIRIDLAQYREMEVFTQFSSDLDDATKQQLQYGKSLMEMLKQPLCHPLNMHEQVISLCVATNKLLVDLPIEQIKRFQMDLLAHFEEDHRDIVDELENGKELTTKLEESIIEIAKQFKSDVWQSEE